MVEKAKDLISLGFVARPHGIKGEILFIPYNPNCSTLKKNLKVLIDGKNFKILRLKRYKKGSLILFSEINTRNDAEALKGKEIFVKKDSLPKLNEDEYYHCDIINCMVISDDKGFIGVVEEIMTTSVDILVVKGKKEYLIPVTDEYIKNINTEEKVITVQNLKKL